MARAAAQKDLSKTINGLRRNGFEVHLTKTKKDALCLLLKLVPEDVTVGSGGSMTLEEIGILKRLADRGQKLLSHWKPGLTPQAKHELRRKALLSHVYLSSANAITRTGELVNTDAYGNRVAAMIFGPKKVFVVAGKNKIVKDVSSAVRRIRNIAAPKNAKRLSLNTPCVKTGYCVDCNSPQRICRVTTIISKAPTSTPITVILVDEALGY